MSERDDRRSLTMFKAQRQGFGRGPPRRPAQRSEIQDCRAAFPRRCCKFATLQEFFTLTPSLCLQKFTFMVRSIQDENRVVH